MLLEGESEARTDVICCELVGDAITCCEDSDVNSGKTDCSSVDGTVFGVIAVGELLPASETKDGDVVVTRIEENRVELVDCVGVSAATVKMSDVKGVMVVTEDEWGMVVTEDEWGIRRDTATDVMGFVENNIIEILPNIS